MALNRLPELGSNVSVHFSLLRDLLTVNVMHRSLFIVSLTAQSMSLFMWMISLSPGLNSNMSAGFLMNCAPPLTVTNWVSSIFSLAWKFHDLLIIYFFLILDMQLIY